MFQNRKSFQLSIQDFHAARSQAALRDILARLTRKSDDLLAYEEVARQLHLSARSERGVQSIPITAIVGSVGRASDFTRTFLPRREQDAERWARVHQAFADPNSGNIPPIDVYQVGEVYFVLDGNHRVSVARRAGITYIDARVIEIASPVTLTPDITPDDLICKAEFADFLRATDLEHTAREFDFSTGQCGQYPKLLAQIEAHRDLLNRSQAGAVSLPQAAADWLEKVYAPVIAAIRAHNVLRGFPDHTETDLYLWVVEHQRELAEELGWNITADAALNDLATRAQGDSQHRTVAVEAWRSNRLADRYLDRLFASLLVAFTDSPAGWNALAQAILIAQQERASILGLYIVRAAQNKNDARAQALHARFHAHLANANVQGELAIESGNVARKIAERARLTDLTVLGVSHPPTGSVATFASGWRPLLQNIARPLFAVPGEPALIRHAVLICDARPQLQPALFVAAYLAEAWQTALTVLMRNDSAHPSADSFAHVRAYLELHEVNAKYILSDGSPQAIVETLDQLAPDVTLLGNDRESQWQQLRGKGLASLLLRASRKPVLIC